VKRSSIYIAVESEGGNDKGGGAGNDREEVGTWALRFIYLW